MYLHTLPTPPKLFTEREQAAQSRCGAALCGEAPLFVSRKKQRPSNDLPVQSQRGALVVARGSTQRRRP